jgi:hypothetical protein
LEIFQNARASCSNWTGATKVPKSTALRAIPTSMIKAASWLDHFFKPVEEFFKAADRIST